MFSFSRRTAMVTTAVTFIATALVASTLVVVGTNEPSSAAFDSPRTEVRPREVTIPVVVAAVDVAPATPVDTEPIPAPTVPLFPAPAPFNPPAPTPIPAPAPNPIPVSAPTPVAQTLTPPCAASTASASAAAASVHTLLNESRAAAGLPGLVLSPSLSTVAAAWAATLSKTSFVHNPNIGQQIPVGSGGWAENIMWTATTTTPEHLHNAWGASPSHRANMVSTTFTHVGMAVVRLPDGGTGAVQVFATYPVGCAV